MKELYINGRLVDLSENPIAMTYAVNNLGELKDRQASFSNMFKCPPTENNREIFGYADSDSFTQDQPYKILPAKLVQEGIEILPKGVALIQSVDKSFEVQVLSGLKSFASLIEGKYLTDLTFPEHPWNIDTCTNTQSNLTELNYPIIDYGSLSELNKTVDVRQLRPATFNKYIIDRIITEAGYNWEGDVMNDPIFNAEILPFAKDAFEHGQAFIGERKQYALTSTKIADQSFFPNGWDTLMVVQFEKVVDISGSFDGRIYLSKIKSTFSISVKFDATFFADPPKEYNVAIQLRKAGQTKWNFFTLLAPSSAVAYQVSGQQDFNGNTLEAEIQLNVGDSLRVVVEHFANFGNRSYTIKSGAKISVMPIAGKVLFGDNIQLEATLPKISQKDHLKDFMQRYCLTPVVDNYKKTIYFKSFTNLYENKPIARDWTSKFTAQQPATKFSFGNYGQVNYGKYKEDAALQNKELGIGRFVVNNETLKPENDAVISPFAPTETIIKLQDLEVPYIKKIADPLKTLDFTVKTEPRILINRIISNPGISFTDGVSTVIPNSISVPYFVKTGFDGLGFDELFDRHYYELINYLLRKPRLVTREVTLNEEDIAELDHFIPIYDANEAQYYYLNRISDYIEGEPAKCEFIRM